MNKEKKSHSIQKLSWEVINQISAGEVVERPANMVKELIENSLDAGASKIEIHFSEGGRFVQIKDNGCGIKRSDLSLALDPHSTSKISHLEDIWNVGSYGFRGEALASIAGVSDLTLISKPTNQAQAGCLKSEFGKKSVVESINSEEGTTVIIKNLFQNTPARLKFLKSEVAETTVIKNTIKAMALSHPKTSFRVLAKNKLLFYWPAVNDLKQRAEQVLLLEKPFYTNTKYKDMRVEAVFCAPNNTSAHRRNMWFFVENRWVEDLTMYSAVMSAYRGLLMHGEYPILVLNFFCPREGVDVNAHPTKSKVRFKNSSSVFKAVHHSLRAVLETAPWVPRSKAPLEQELSFSAKGFNQVQFQKKKIDSSFTHKKNYFSSPPFRGENIGDKNQAKGFVASAVKNLKIEPLEEIKKWESEGEVSESSFATQKENSSLAKAKWGSLHILSQAHLTYILAQSETAILFVDQHAAHERVLYERLMLSWNTGKGDIQNRLVPLALDSEESLVQALLSVKKDLLKLGLEMELSGPGGLVIRSAPAILKDTALKQALVQLGGEIRSAGAGFAVERKISDLCATMACHSAVRAGQSLSAEEMKELLVQMDEFPLSGFCPHGRPVFVEYPLIRLEKDFGRRV